MIAIEVSKPNAKSFIISLKYVDYWKLISRWYQVQFGSKFKGSFVISSNVCLGDISILSAGTDYARVTSHSMTLSFDNEWATKPVGIKSYQNLH